MAAGEVVELVAAFHLSKTSCAPAPFDCMNAIWVPSIEMIGELVTAYPVPVLYAQ
jgi:hypothetical protein